MPYLLQAVRSGRFAWIDGGHYLTSSTHVDNLAEAVCCALTRGAGGRVYHICDGAPVPFRRLIDAQLLAYGVKPPEKQVPRALLRVFIGLDDLFRRLRLPLRAPMTARSSHLQRWRSRWMTAVHAASFAIVRRLRWKPESRCCSAKWPSKADTHRAIGGRASRGAWPNSRLNSRLN